MAGTLECYYGVVLFLARGSCCAVHYTVPVHTDTARGRASKLLMKERWRSQVGTGTENKVHLVAAGWWRPLGLALTRKFSARSTIAKFCEIRVDPLSFRFTVLPS